MKAATLACAPIIMLGMLGSAPAAYAAHYVEVWNPPEARAHPPLRHPGPARSHVSARLTAGHAGQTDRHVTAQRTAVTAALSASSAAPSASASLSSRHRAVLAWPPAVIPRQPGPDGRALQV